MEDKPLNSQNFETESQTSKSKSEKPQEDLTKIVPEEFKPSEKRELFRREEVRTMRKDIQRLEEEQAIREREKLAQLKTKEEIQKEKERIARLKKEEEEKMFAKSALLEAERSKLQAERQEALGLEQTTPQIESEPPKKEWPKPKYTLPFTLPKKPSKLSKFMVRTLITGVLFIFWTVIITFWYWFLFVRTKPSEVTPSYKPPTQQSSLQQPPQRPELSISILPTETQNIIEFSSPEELPTLFENTVRKLGPENTFTRIAFYNTSQNSYLNLLEFLSIFKVNMPAELSNQIEDEFTAFIYTSQIANRFGIIVKVKDPDLTRQTMLNWEPNMEKDTENLFNVLGKRESAKNKTFRKAIYKGQTFRYLSFPAINFGLVWSVLDIKNPNTGQIEYYLVITSSGESMLEIINRIL